MLTKKLVKTLFDYDWERGELVWKIKRQGVRTGSDTGRKTTLGYRMVMIDQKEYRTHRVIWLWHNGKLPSLIDHIDRNKTNNRIENLRAATHSQNKSNAVKRVFKVGTSSRWKGVCFDKVNKKWMAYLTNNGRFKNLGRFETESEAAIAYNNCAIEIFGDFACLNEVSS